MNDSDADKNPLTPDPIRIAVFDEHQMFRQGVLEMLKRVGGFEIVGEGATAADAVETAKVHAPDVILLDLYMPGDGIEAVACISRDCPNVRTIMLTSSESEQDVVSALQAGARGYVLKGAGESEVVDAVHAVVQGNFYFTPNLAAQLLIDRSKRIETRRQRRPSVIPLFARRNSLPWYHGACLN
jgi:two-component system, NarL family, nitrate/nitrite response regulator NarL